MQHPDTTFGTLYLVVEIGPIPLRTEILIPILFLPKRIIPISKYFFPLRTFSKLFENNRNNFFPMIPHAFFFLKNFRSACYRNESNRNDHREQDR